MKCKDVLFLIGVSTADIDRIFLDKIENKIENLKWCSDAEIYLLR